MTITHYATTETATTAYRKATYALTADEYDHIQKLLADDKHVEVNQYLAELPSARCVYTDSSGHLGAFIPNGDDISIYPSDALPGESAPRPRTPITIIGAPLPQGIVNLLANYGYIIQNHPSNLAKEKSEDDDFADYLVCTDCGATNPAHKMVGHECWHCANAPF